MRGTSTPATAIAVVLPALNEAAVIGKVIDGIPRNIKQGKHKLRLDIIVVNDGSSDKTAQVVATKKRVKLINHIVQSGVGAATRTGLHYARDNGYQFVICMDADGQHSSKDAEMLAKAIIKNKSDLIIGSRLLGDTAAMPTYKKVGNKGLGVITYVLPGVYASDTQSGLKAFNRKAITSLEFVSNDYAFCSEMLWKAHKLNLRISELPVETIYTDYSLASKRGQRNYSGGMNIVRQLIKRRLMEFMHG